ncbi:PREDICTED: uncharacterized protein LOC109231610 [Nicotiana attenuata]|nr:PREDICTED: uncharacterized protein LOC109231610 [Nicotiana attenuata]
MLSSMGINCPTLCQYCNAGQEDIDHIFFVCPNAAQFWNAIRSKSTSPPPTNPLNSTHLWQTDNNVFNNKRELINAKNTIAKATEFQLLKGSSNNTCTHQMMLKWEPPPRGCFKLNTDGAVKGKVGIGGIGGIGGIFRNHNGDWILGYMENIPYTSILEAEFRALIKGLQLAEQNNLLPLHIDTDSVEIIGMLTEGNLIFDPLICECRLLIQRMGRVVVRHAFREQNRVADALAKEAVKKTFWNRSVVLAVPPVFVNDIVWVDTLGTELPRLFLGCNIVDTILHNIAELGTQRYHVALV